MVAALLVAPAPRLSAAEPASPVALELVVCSRETLERWRFEIEIDGQSQVDRWGLAMTRLFDFVDRDGDGALDRTEAARLPHPHSLRQTLWSRFVAQAASPAWEKFDADEDGRIDRREMSRGYERLGLSGVVVAVGSPPETERLTAALLEQLQLAPGQLLDEHSWSAAAERLLTLDRNGDELISPGELLPHARYPGASATALLTPPREVESSSEAAARTYAAASVTSTAETDPLPLVLLPRDARDIAWCGELMRRLDRNGDEQLARDEIPLAARRFRQFQQLDRDGDRRLAADELAAWRDFPADTRWILRVGNRDEKAFEIEQEIAREDTRVDARHGFTRLAPLWMRVQIGDSALSADWRRGRGQLLEQFAEVAEEGAVATEQLAAHPKLTDLKTLHSIADRDGDRRLAREELVAWLDALDHVITAQTLFSLLDHRRGLFELLDADYNGGLSAAELRCSWRRIESAGCVVDGRIRQNRLPRQLRSTVSRGLPFNHLASAVQTGPAWFRAMDRNGDGRLSASEFLGPRPTFARFDHDGDNVISPLEAGGD